MIPVTILQFHLGAEQPFRLGSSPGTCLRGGLYEALRKIYDNGREVHAHQDYDDNPVAWLLRLEDQTTSGGKDVPRPITIRPPLDTGTSRLTFEITFLGHGRRCMPMLISGVHALQVMGLGVERQHFQLLGVDAVHPISGRSQPLLDSLGSQISPLPAPLTAEDYQQAAQEWQQDTLKVEFLTPTIIAKGKQICQRPEFLPLFQRLLERVRLLSELYCDEPLLVDFGDLLRQAAGVRSIVDATRPVQRRIKSRRTQQIMPVNGFVGSATYAAVPADLWRWILIGQALQVGQHTIRGYGWYRVLPNLDRFLPI